MKRDRFERTCKDSGKPRLYLPCARCVSRVHFDPRNAKMRVAIRCEWCLRVFCRKCALAHFTQEERSLLRALQRAASSREKAALAIVTKLARHITRASKRPKKKLGL